MTARPLVSIITPVIPERMDLLVEAMHNLRQQAYPNMEHIIVVEAPDDDAVTRARLEVIPCQDRFVPTSIAALGRNWTTFLPSGSFGIAPLLTGMLMARGEYQMWLGDDERMTPDHISSLVELLEQTGADFAYSKTRMHWIGQRPENGWDIGTDPPRYGQITNFLYRADLLKHAMPAFGKHPVDWALVSAWMAAGASWAFLPRVTFTHRADR